MIRAVRSSKAIPISTGRVNRRDAIMTGRFACRGEEGREGKIGARQALWRAQIRWICRVRSVSRVHDRLGRRQIYPEFPCRISRGPSSDAVIRTTILSVARMAKKKMICDEVIYFIYIYIVCFFLARSRVRVLELEFIPRWTWNDSNRINRICM